MKFPITFELGEYLQQTPERLNDPVLFCQVQKRIGTFYRYFFRLYKNNPVQAFHSIFNEIDQLLLQIPTHLKERVSCRKGCNFCCSLEIDAYPEEVAIILKYCKKQNIQVDWQYLAKQAAFSPEDRMVSVEYGPCVFLKDGLCSIYPVRPIACRKYIVVTPQEYCNLMVYPPGTKSHIAGYFNEEVGFLLSALLSIAKGSNRFITLLTRMAPTQ